MPRRGGTCRTASDHLYLAKPACYDRNDGVACEVDGSL
jgi:hypothetical protein